MDAEPWCSTGMENAGSESDDPSSASGCCSLLPRESECAERKRPAAIQELLEKKRARLTATSGGSCLQHQTTKVEMLKGEDEEEGPKGTVDPQGNREEDTETVSSSGSSKGGMCTSTYASTSASSLGELNLGQLLKRAMTDPGRLLTAADSQMLAALQETLLQRTGPNAHNGKAEDTATAVSPSSCSPAKVEKDKIGESPLSLAVPNDRIFAQVPGRLSLLSNVVKYKMSVGEVKRRLMGPESFNFSLLGALLRRAKMPEKSQMLVDELNQVGLSIPRGRRRLSQVTLLSALTEAESVQFARDFKKIADAEFPSQQMAVELLKDAENKAELRARIAKLSAALKMSSEFIELLNKDRSPVQESTPEFLLSQEVQNPLCTFSMLTHGFGNPAIQVGVGCFVQFLKHQIRLLEDLLGDKDNNIGWHRGS